MLYRCGRDIADGEKGVTLKSISNSAGVMLIELKAQTNEEGLLVVEIDIECQI